MDARELKMFMEANNIQQKELAKEIGKSANHISELLNGKAGVRGKEFDILFEIVKNIMNGKDNEKLKNEYEKERKELRWEKNKDARKHTRAHRRKVDIALYKMEERRLKEQGYL